MNLDTRLRTIIKKYQQIFRALPHPCLATNGSTWSSNSKYIVEFEGSVVRRRPYPTSKDQMDDMERKIQECIDAGLVEESKHGDYSSHCSAGFVVATGGSTAMLLAVDNGEVNKKTPNHSGSILNMENTVHRLAKCRFNTPTSKRSEFCRST